MKFTDLRLDRLGNKNERKSNKSVCSTPAKLLADF